LRCVPLPCIVTYLPSVAIPGQRVAYSGLMRASRRSKRGSARISAYSGQYCSTKKPAKGMAPGSIRVVSEDDSRREAIEQVEPAERGHALAELGLWYDAYDFFAGHSRAHTEL